MSNIGFQLQREETKKPKNYYFPIGLSISSQDIEYVHFIIFPVSRKKREKKKRSKLQHPVDISQRYPT